MEGVYRPVATRYPAVAMWSAVANTAARQQTALLFVGTAGATARADYCTTAINQAGCYNCVLLPAAGLPVAAGGRSTT